MAASRRGGFRLAALLLLLPSLGAAQPVGSCTPAAGADGWPVARAETRGLDPAALCALGPALAALEGANAHGIVVARDGALVYEAYFAGDDRRWPQQHWREPLLAARQAVDTRHDVQSISKSVTALLLGAALERGLLKSVDDGVLSILGGYDDLRAPQRERLRLRDLLTMTSGLRWPQRPYLDMARRMEAASDPVRFVLEQPMVAEPGLLWHYNNGSAEVAGAVVARAAGRPLAEFAREALFAPLGIDDWEWGTMANGAAGASWGLRLRLRDLAKLGQLVLDRGAWQGKRILPAPWIEIMTAPQIARSRVAYGFLWWLGRERLGDAEVETVAAYGWGGQLLAVVPRLRLVVAVNAGAYDFDGGGDQNRAGRLALERVLGAVTAP
ncbi:MAG: serine hydrolase [Reyranellaceae bacterium]